MIIVKTSSLFLAEKGYVFSVFFNEFLGIDYKVEQTNDLDRKIWVCDGENCLTFPDVLFTSPQEAWLTKRSFPKLPLRHRSLEDLKDLVIYNAISVPVFYGDESLISPQFSNPVTNFDIDIFGTIFFLITMYEEYPSNEKDEFERYLYTQSILYKEGLLNRPIVNEYLEIFQYLLNRKFGIKPKVRKYRIELSHDVDSPLIHTQPYVNFIRSLAADLVQRKSPRTFIKRSFSRFLPGEERRCSFDPHNNFNFLMSVGEDLDIRSQFNFITIDGQGSIDGNYDIGTPFFKKLLKLIHDRNHLIGFHPSYYSYDKAAILKAEFQALQDVCSSISLNIDSWGGRQHYLRWRNPITWRIWEEAGLQHDSTIGSEYFLGFRNGCCLPYSVYDLERRRTLKLKETPLIVMDVAAFKLGDFNTYATEIAALSKVCKFYGGVFTILFHNNYMITPKQQQQYIELLKSIQ